MQAIAAQRLSESLPSQHSVRWFSHLYQRFYITPKIMAYFEDWHHWTGGKQPTGSNINPSQPPAEVPPLPNYIKASNNITPDNLAYLWNNGALTIPHTFLKNALLLAYIEHVHPSLPLLDLHELLATTCASTINGYPRENQKISLLLFQAIMFAGSAFVDQIFLQMAGYGSRREARAIFYQRVKLLYDVNYKIDDKLAVVQSFLLMTYWHEVPYDGKDEWHWLGNAIEITTSLQNRAAIVDLNTRDQKVWNRVWWCCFTRDRLLSFGLRRTPRIEEDDGDSFTTPTLTLNDFESRKIDADNLTISLSGCHIAQDTSLQLQIARTFMAKVELCICIGHVLKTQYHLQIRDKGEVYDEANGRLSSKETLVPNLEANGFEACRAELAHWLQSLPPELMYTTPTIEQLSAEGNSLSIEKAVLHTIFSAILSTLHRPRALSKVSGSPTSSARIIRDASADITRTYMDLYQLNLIRFLPTTAVTVLLPAIISHIETIRTSSNETSIREEATRGLAQCMQILQELRDNYQPADESIYMLELALKHANIHIASEHMLSPTTAECIFNGESKRSEHSGECWGTSFTPNKSVQRYEDALKTTSTTDSDFQVIDPAVSLLSEELAWLDNAFAAP